MKFLIKCQQRVIFSIFKISFSNANLSESKHGILCTKSGYSFHRPTYLYKTIKYYRIFLSNLLKFQRNLFDEKKINIDSRLASRNLLKFKIFI